MVKQNLQDKPTEDLEENKEMEKWMNTWRLKLIWVEYIYNNLNIVYQFNYVRPAYKALW